MCIRDRTKRQEWEESSAIDTSLYDERLTCQNPAGQLNAELFHACAVALEAWSNESKTTLIDVDGEEDLAPLLLHPMAPLGAVVLYGQPNRGVVLRWTGSDSKLRCRELLAAMDRA